MSTMRTTTAARARERRGAYPNVAPEPSMYCPSVRMMPFGPAPYLKMLTVPATSVRHYQARAGSLQNGQSIQGAVPKMKPMITPTAAWSNVSNPQDPTGGAQRQGNTYCRPSWRPSSLRHS